MASYGYTYEYRSPGFPDSVVPRGDFQDVSDSVGTLINTINTYRSQGRYDAATALIRQNAETLAKSSFGAYNINSLIEDLRNAQIYAQGVSQEISTSTTEPEASSDDFLWIGDIDV